MLAIAEDIWVGSLIDEFFDSFDLYEHMSNVSDLDHGVKYRPPVFAVLDSF